MAGEDNQTVSCSPIGETNASQYLSGLKANKKSLILIYVFSF